MLEHLPHVQGPGIDPSTTLLDFDFVIIDLLNCPLFYPLLLFFSRIPRDRKTGTKPCLNRSTSWTEVPIFTYISHVILWEFVVDWLWSCSQFIWTPGVRSLYWIPLGTGLPGFGHAPAEHRWEGCTCACFGFGTWGQLASPPSQLLCRAGGWERHSAHVPAPICLENRQFHLPPASSFRNSLCQPMTALWGDQMSKGLDWEFRKLFFPGACLQALVCS